MLIAWIFSEDVSMPTVQAKAAPVFRPNAGAVSPKHWFTRFLNAVLEADRNHRETCKLSRLDYPHLRDMGIDLGRTREDRRR